MQQQSHPDGGARQFRALFERTPDAVLIADERGTYVDVNPAACALLALPENEIVGKSAVDFVVPDGGQGFDQMWEAFLRQGTQKGVMRLRRADGDVVQVEYAATADFVPGRHLSVMRDVTERIRAEERLRESEERLRLFVTAASDITYRMSADWGEMLALQGKSFLADSKNPSLTWLEEYIPDSDKALAQAAISEAVRARTMFELEHRVIRADGSIGWVFSRAIPFLDGRGEIVEWFGAASDITERKRAETNFAFLAEVSQDLARLTSIDETMGALGAKIGRFLGVKQCTFAEHADEFETPIVSYGWNAGGAPSSGGTYRMRDFLSDELMAALAAGEPLVVGETRVDEHVSAECCGALGIRSFIIVPLVRGSEWQFQLSIVDDKPREWRDDEVELMRELTTRIWGRLERVARRRSLAPIGREISHAVQLHRRRLQHHRSHFRRAGQADRLPDYRNQPRVRKNDRAAAGRCSGSASS